jgi:hypothetical protein
MHEILEEYLDIFQDGKFVSKIEKKQRHSKLINWYKKEYNRILSYQDVEQFMNDNDNINFTRQFYFKVVFPVVDYEVNENDNAQCLVSIFNKDQILQYAEYKDFKISILDIENQVLEKDPNNAIVLNYRLQRQKHFFKFTIHEVPSGVLCGMNGATREQIKGLKEDIKDYTKLCIQLNFQDDELIENCKIYYDAWENYINNSKEYNGFQDYLEKHKVVF